MQICRRLLSSDINSIQLKGTVSQGFLDSVFFISLLILVLFEEP
jgi:hypothetical protein